MKVGLGISFVRQAYICYFFKKKMIAEKNMKLQKRKLKVSLIMIVRDEEANIGACLQSVKGLMDEIIVVDTGSTDRTKEIASINPLTDCKQAHYIGFFISDNHD